MAANNRYLYGKDALFLEKAVQQIAAAGGLRTEITSGTEAPNTLMPDSPLLALRKAAEQTAENLGKESMQKRKEDRMDEKNPVNSAQIKKDRADKALADFEEKADFDAASAHDRKRWETERKRLKQEAEQAAMEAAEREDYRIQQQVTADIEAMPEEDLALLDSYVRNRDNRQDVFVNDISWFLSHKNENDALKALTEKYGEDKVLQLAEIYGMGLHEKNAADAASQGREGVNDSWISATVHNLLGIPARALGTISGFTGRMSAAANRTGQFHGRPEHTAGDELSAYGGAVTEQTAQNIEGDVYDEEGNRIKDGGFLRDVASRGYQGAMNVVDSAARLAMSGGNSTIASVVAGMGTFNQSMQKYSAMGASPEKAVLAATASAGLEYITEKLPTEKVLEIFHKGGGTSAVKEVLKQAFLVEPTGEEVNLFAGMAAEALILGENSSKQQRIGDLIAGGMTKAEAEKQFWKETFLEAVNTYAVSVFAGLFGGGAAAYAGNQVQTRQDQQPTVAPAAPKATPAPPVAPPVETVQQEVKPEAATPAPEAPAPAPVAQQQDPLQSVTRPETQQNLQKAIESVTGPAEQAQAKTAPVRLFRGFNQSNIPTERNLTQRQSVYNLIGKEDPNEIKNLLPLAYYTESEEDARSYAEMDKRNLERYRQNGVYEYRQKIMNGQDTGGLTEAEYADKAAKDSFRIMHGRDANDGGHVESYAYTPGKTLDLTELGDYTNADAVYKTLAVKLGMTPEELDNILAIGDAVDDSDDFHAYQLLRNTPRNDLGSRVIELAKKAGYDSVRYSEGGNSHYAIMTDQDGWDSRLQKANDYYDEFEDFNTGGANREDFLGRDWDAVGKKNVKAYMYEHPEVKPFFQSEAQIMLMELADTTRGERYYNEDVHYESGGESGWGGVKRSTSDDIAYLLDTAGFSYDQIQKGLEAIVHDKGAENNATSKRIEFILHNRLMNGHNDFYSNERVPASDDYVNLINEKQITTYDTEPVAPASNVQASASKTEATTGSPPTADSKTMPAEGGQSQIKGTGAAEGNFSGKPAYNATLSEDNAQADRRNDVRPMELPALDINVGNVSAVTGDVYASRNTPDDLAAAMEEPVAKGDFSYVRISNDVATQRARQSIGDAGSWETARDHFRMDVDKGLAGAELSARGALILNHAAEVYEQAKASGDTQAAARAKKEWLKILSDVQKLGTNTAQGLQAMRIIRDLMPQDKIQFTRIAVENMVRDMRIDTDIQIDEQLLTEYENAATDQQRDEIMEKIQQNVADQIPSTWLDKWNALRYTNMLGNLKTNVRNIAGNVANSAVYRMKDATGAVLETIANKVSNGKVGRTKSVVVNKQIRKACAEYYQQVKNAVGSGGKYGDNNTAAGDFAQGVMDRRQIFKFKPMEGYRKATNWMMNNERFGDEAFGKTAFARAMAGYLQANGVRNEADIRNASPDLIDKAMVYAVKEAQETTFHDNSALANVLGRLKKDAGIVGEGLIPFTKTPANVLTRAEEYSPIGLINTAITAYKAAKPGSDVTGTDVINSLSKSLTGTAIFALGAILQSQGILNGGPDDDEEQAAFDKMNGIQPYSINLPNGTTYTLDWLTPIAMPLFMGAQLMDIASEKDLTFADLERVFTSIADPMIQMSMMQGINSSLENIKYSENNMGQFFINAAVSYLTQGLTNTLLGQVERSSEENRMTTYIDKDSSVPQWMQQALGKASQKVPGWDYQQTEYVDAWGETQKNEGGFFYNLLSPGYSQKVRDDTVTRELNRLKAAGVEENVFPDMASTTVTWTDKKGTVHENDNLTAEQHQTLAKIQGQTSRELLEDMFASKDYAALTDAQKAKAINSAYLYARKTGEIAAIDGHTGYDQTWMMDVKKKGANEILRQAFNSDLNGSMSALDSAWDNGYNEETFNRELQNAYDSYSKATPEMKKQVYEEAEGTTKRYLEARSKGISHIDFVAVAENIAKVKGTGSINKDTGKATVRDIDKRKAIANTKGMTSSEIDILMKAYMPDYDPKAASPEMTELKYQYVREELGLSPKEYATTYQAYLDADKRNDKIAAIRALGYDYSTANALYKLYYGSMKKELLELYG